MSNVLTIEVSLDNKDPQFPMVLILAHDGYGNEYMRPTALMFKELYPNEEALKRDVLSWDSFEGDLDCYSAIVVENFQETVRAINRLPSNESNLARLRGLIEGEYSVMFNFDHFCLMFNPEKIDGGYYEDGIEIADEVFDIDFTPEKLEAATVDKDGTWTIGDMTLEFFELKKVK